MNQYEYQRVTYSNFAGKEYYCPANAEGTATSGRITPYQLNKFGQEGWELCAVDSDDTWNTYYFKRELPRCENVELLRAKITQLENKIAWLEAEKHM